MKTFNQRVSEGVHDGTISEITIDGCRCYVCSPRPGEEVVGYVGTSDLHTFETPTKRAEREAREK